MVLLKESDSICEFKVNEIEILQKHCSCHPYFISSQIKLKKNHPVEKFKIEKSMVES